MDGDRRQCFGGLLGGMLHAMATATFGVNHIVSGFAINIIAPGVARFIAGLVFVDAAGAGIEGGSITNSPGISSPIGRFTLPLLSGGDLFGWATPDPLAWLEDKQWFVVSDVAGFLNGLPHNVDPDVTELPSLDFSSGYVQRSIAKMPKQGSKRPWRLYQNYALDIVTLRYGRIDDGVMQILIRLSSLGAPGRPCAISRIRSPRIVQHVLTVNAGLTGRPLRCMAGGY